MIRKKIPGVLALLTSSLILAACSVDKVVDRRTHSSKPQIDVSGSALKLANGGLAAKMFDSSVYKYLPSLASPYNRADAIPLAGNFNDKNSVDLALYFPASADWLIDGQTRLNFGAVGLDIPVPGDYDGTGKTEVAVYRPTTGEWFIRGPAGNRRIQFGATTDGSTPDIPVPGDYDGIGKTQLAVYRPATGEWFISGHAQPIQFGNVTAGGVNSDIPVPRDYDGIGKVEIAVYRPTTGEWFIRGPAGNRRITFGAVTTGANPDIPLPGDYDGRGKALLAVFRPTTGQWFVAGHTIEGAIGQGGLLPVTIPNAFGNGQDGFGVLDVVKQSVALYKLEPNTADGKDHQVAVGEPRLVDAGEPRPTYCVIGNAANASPELNACIQKTSDNETVYIPTGTYTLNSSVSVSRGITLYGNGGLVTLKPAFHSAIVDFPDAPNRAKLVAVTVDFSGATGAINMARYFAPAKPSPIVLAEGTSDFPVTQVFGPGHASWVTFPRSFLLPPTNSTSIITSEGFNYWTWGSDQYVYLHGEMRDPLENGMPSYRAGNYPSMNPGHPPDALAYAYLNAFVGQKFAIDSPGQVIYQFYPFPSGTCPHITYNGESDPSHGIEAVKGYHLRAWISFHSVIDFGGDIGFQDAVALQILSNYEDTNTDPLATEVYYLSPEWGYVKYTDNKLNQDYYYNKIVAAGTSIGSLDTRSKGGFAYYNAPGPVNCIAP